MTLVLGQGDKLPLKSMCDALAINRTTVYWRKRRATMTKEQKLKNLSRKHCTQSRALSTEERAEVLAILTGNEFMDQTPNEIYHALLENGKNPCSISTMHRILRKNQLNGERRQQRPAQHNAIPRLRATKPNEVWSWDCSKLATSGTCQPVLYT